MVQACVRNRHAETIGGNVRHDINNSRRLTRAVHTDHLADERERARVGDLKVDSDVPRCAAVVHVVEVTYLPIHRAALHELTKASQHTEPSLLCVRGEEPALTRVGVDEVVPRVRVGYAKAAEIPRVLETDRRFLTCEAQGRQGTNRASHTIQLRDRKIERPQQQGAEDEEGMRA